MTDERELLDAWRRGDRSAGNELFQRHFLAVHRFFVNKAEGAEIEELLQRTFIASVEGRDRFEGRSSFRAYLLGIAYRVLLDYYRGKRRNPTYLSDSVLPPDDGPGASTLHRHKRSQRLLLEALRRIPLESQFLLELHYWEQLTGKQMARILDIPQNTLWSRIRSAKARLRKAVETLQHSKDVLASTTHDLDRWAASIRRAHPAHAR